MELPRRIILGWSPAGVCTGCGQGRRPVTQRDLIVDHIQNRSRGYGNAGGLGVLGSHVAGNGKINGSYVSTITDYACACPDTTAPTKPSVVLDPFGGTGTTALVASALGRHGITIDMSADYTRLARWRCTDPAQRAAALQVPKPPPIPDGQDALFAL